MFSHLLHLHLQPNFSVCCVSRSMTVDVSPTGDFSACLHLDINSRIFHFWSYAYNEDRLRIAYLVHLIW